MGRRVKVIKNWLRDTYYHLYWRALILFRYRDKEGYPLKCTQCGLKQSKYGYRLIDEYYIDHLLIEHGAQCKRCGHINGHWTYGSWEPFYF